MAVRNADSKGSADRAAAGAAGARTDSAPRETRPEQFASFIGFFIYLLILKTFFLPLFIIPTGSMAATLYGEHVLHTCPNCGVEYAVSWPLPHPQHSPMPPVILCPNCRWRESVGDRGALAAGGLRPGEIAGPLRPMAGDRIFVHGWPFALPLANVAGLGPQRWDVVVFKVPRDNETNYIKRLIGLPGELIELIDGDLFVNGRIATKPADAQQSLWMRFYDHDYLPAGPARDRYHPRWVALAEGGPWEALESRRPAFTGAQTPAAEIQFVTEPGPARSPGRVTDFYAYNGFSQPGNIVSDVRLSAEVTFAGGDGWFELSTSKHGDRFFARLTADGRLTLEHAAVETPDVRTVWQAAEALGRPRIDTRRPVTLALANADYVVEVLVNGEPVLRSTPEQYSITLEQARMLALGKVPSPMLRCAAGQCRLTLAHLLIERDIYYTGGLENTPTGAPGRPANAGLGRPLQLGPAEYFCCGDNSPNSLDGRYWFDDTVGPLLQAKLAAGRYTPGTVPADQMIGRAFFVYWPGMQPLPKVVRTLLPWLPNIVPDMGRARWIH